MLSDLFYILQVIKFTSETDKSVIKKNEMGIDEGQLEPGTVTSLPVLCIDDGKMILRFSEFFGIQEPVRK
jgi:hypothetical protein